MKKQIDRWFLSIVIILIVIGFFIFFSAALGLLAREGAKFGGVIFNQFLGLFIGLSALLVILKINYKTLKKYSFYIFLASILATAAVFIPDLGFSHGGAQRWLLLGPFSFQPAEFLKIGFIIYFAAWLSAAKTRVQSFTYGLVPLLVMMGVVGLILLRQPDTGTFMIIFGTALAMFIASGARWRHIGLLAGLASGGLAFLAYTRPYIKERLLTFLNPAIDPQGAGYQIQQSLIAIGSGEIFGRGFGQSIQKFNFLPEPVSDSIFAVFAEDFGFMGSALLVMLFAFFAFRGLVLANRAPDHFSRLVVLGIVILITSQAFLNIGSMLGVFPLTGLPLPFISHGGSALIFTLIAVGIVLNISKHRRT